MIPFVIFTDLDGTLLDHHTYSAALARPALHKSRRLKIPVVFCTSKTREETEFYRARFRNGHPFIVENGAGIYIPENYFPFVPPDSHLRAGYRFVSLGASHKSVIRALDEIARDTGLSLKGLSSMSTAEVSRLTGLGRIQASRAKKREFTEPFVVLSREPSTDLRLGRAAARRKMLLTRGGRFYSLSGGGDKGEAVKMVAGFYRKIHPNLVTVGIGDNLNDFSMLRAVDLPWLVRKPGGGYQKSPSVRRFLVTNGIGPAGWSEAVLNLLKNKDLELLGGKRHG